MGCFNGGCKLSKLPISWNDDVVGYIVKLNKTNAFQCYPTDIAEPIFPPVFGKYNDYGSMENIEETEISKIIVEWFKKQLKSDDFKAYQDYYLPKNVDEMTIEEAMTLAERGFVIGRYGYKLVLVHRKIYDAMTENTKGIEYMEEIAQYLKEKAEKFKTRMEKYKGVFDDEDIMMLSSSGIDHTDLTENPYKFSISGHCSVTGRSVNDTVKHWSKFGKREMEILYRHISFGYVLMDMGMNWMPIPTQGQVIEFDPYKKLMKLMNEHIEIKEKEMGEY